MAQDNFKVSSFKIVFKFPVHMLFVGSGERNPVFIRFSKEFTIPPNLRLTGLEPRLFYYHEFNH